MFELMYGENGVIVLVDNIRTTKRVAKELKVRTIKASEHTECPITCTDIETKCTTNCGHVFEHSALLKALEQNETCPVCRAEVNIIIL
jgi:SUMO ligase MMS21 Smc5/6 complex component